MPHSVNPDYSGCNSPVAVIDSHRPIDRAESDATDGRIELGLYWSYSMINRRVE